MVASAAVKLDAVEAFAATLPGVAVGKKWNKRTWILNDRGFLWERPLGKADIARFGDAPLPSGDIIAVVTENLDAKDALLAMDLPGFFTIAHFNGYAAVLIELRLAKAKDVRAAIVDAHRVTAAKAPPKQRKPRPKKKKP